MLSASSKTSLQRAGLRLGESDAWVWDGLGLGFTILAPRCRASRPNLSINFHCHYGGPSKAKILGKHSRVSQNTTAELGVRRHPKASPVWLREKTQRDLWSPLGDLYDLQPCSCCSKPSIIELANVWVVQFLQDLAAKHVILWQIILKIFRCKVLETCFQFVCVFLEDLRFTILKILSTSEVKILGSILMHSSFRKPRQQSPKPCKPQGSLHFGQETFRGIAHPSFGHFLDGSSTFLAAFRSATLSVVPTDSFWSLEVDLKNEYDSNVLIFDNPKNLSYFKICSGFGSLGCWSWDFGIPLRGACPLRRRARVSLLFSRTRGKAWVGCTAQGFDW